jgi:hypothetical protein
MIARNTLAALLAGSLASAAAAAEREEYLPVKKSTFVNLLDLLVQKGVIDRKEAKGLVTEAEQDAKAEAKRREREEAAAKAVAESTGGGAAAGAGAGAAAAGKAGSKSIHVGYVPEFVKKEIHDQVRAELKAEVLKDVKQTAKVEKWSFADALPDWVSRIRPYLDARLRLSDEFFASDNYQYFPDWMAINAEDGGYAEALTKNTAFLNTTHDRLRINERFRVGLDALLIDGLKAGVRLTTTNIYSPVSTNQNLGDYNHAWIVALDRAYLQYDFVDAKGNDWFTFWGGRIPNPFMSTEMMYSAMLSFEGLVGTFRYRFGDSQAAGAYRNLSPTGRYGINLGPQTPDTVFATFGILPLQEVNFSSSDKYIFAAQAGADWLVFNDSRFKLGTAYYDYRNVRARRNALDSATYDWTAPEFMQKGNTIAYINDGVNQTFCKNSGNLGAQNVCLVGLGSNYQILDVTAAFDYAGFAPTHVMLTADYAHNFGFNANYIYNEFGNQFYSGTGQKLSPQTDAYMVRLDVGRPELRRFNDWNVFFTYRYIEADAILDAFNDPIFHQGGTNAKGWSIGAQYGLASNTWLDLRWMSSDAVSGPTLGIDTLNLDINARF